MKNPQVVTRLIIAVGAMALAALAIVQLVPQEPALIPFVVTALLGLLAKIVSDSFPRKSQG